MRETFKRPGAGKRAQRDASDDWHQEKQRAMRRARLERSKAAHDLIRTLLRRHSKRVRRATEIDTVRLRWGS